MSNKEKHFYITVSWRDNGGGWNIPLRYFAKKNLRKKDGFQKEYIRIAKHACRDLGADIKMLGKLLGVTPPTIYKWMSLYEEFKKVIREGSDLYNCYRVEKTLIARALGIEHEEVKRESIELPKNIKKKLNQMGIKELEQLAVKVTRTKKFIPGDPSCLFFYLQNRDSKRWRNTKYIQLDADITTTDAVKLERLERLRKLEKNDLTQLKDVYNKMKKPMKRSLEA